MTISFDLKPTSQPLSEQERAARMEGLAFGRVFSEHMVTLRYTAGQGWHSGQLEPYGPLELDPATMGLHYAQEIFEGYKAYRQPDGGVATFRPEVNGERFNRSAARLAMAELPVEAFVEAGDLLVRQDRDWVPNGYGESLYLRPFMFATEVGLGVRAASEYLFVVIASPSGTYFKGGLKPVTVWLSEDYVRASPGGTGEAKCGGNYAASLLAQAQAAEMGCDQVVWLDAVERRYVEEMGGMNLYFVYGDKIMTPELTGTLLPGVTRRSLLEIGRDLGLAVEEGRISTDQWRRDAESGELTEVFACGTAAAITPVGHVKSTSGDFSIGGGETGSVTMRLREALLDIQHGKAADTHGWLHKVC